MDEQELQNRNERDGSFVNHDEVQPAAVPAVTPDAMPGIQQTVVIPGDSNVLQQTAITPDATPVMQPAYMPMMQASDMSAENNRNEKEANKAPKAKKAGFGATLGKAVAVALVFGLVSGLIFTGVLYSGTKLLGVSSEAEEAMREMEEAREEERRKEAQEADDKQEADDTSSVDASKVIGGSGVIQQGASSADYVMVDVSDVVDAVMPGIVAITNTGSVTYEGFWGMEQTYETESCGSGIIVGQDEQYIYIATNNHVVSGAKSLAVTFCDDAVVEGEIQGTDASDDLAVVRVAIKDIDEDTRSAIMIAQLGDSTTLKVGEPTIAIGNALGYGQSVTTGVVSALGRSATTQDADGNVVVNNNLIQTDAAINPGNSGGALLNGKGEVIGINSVKYSDTDVEGIGYAIPISDAREMIEQLIATGVAYDVSTPYLGIQGKDMVDVSGNPAGVGIAVIIEGSGAEESDIRVNDILIAIDGEEVDSMTTLKEILKNYQAQDVVEVTVLRKDGRGYEQMDIKVRLSSAQELNMTK